MCHVLIIEDEPIIALDLEGLLECEGATSFSFAVSESEAVIAAGLQRPDIITSDVTPGEGTGLTGVDTIRAALGEIPVAFISATARGCCAENRLTRVLSKPVDRPAVASVFRELHQLITA